MRSTSVSSFFAAQHCAMCHFFCEEVGPCFVKWRAHTQSRRSIFWLVDGDVWQMGFIFCTPCMKVRALRSLLALAPGVPPTYRPSTINRLQDFCWHNGAFIAGACLFIFQEALGHTDRFPPLSCLPCLSRNGYHA